jgi:hypothetical protein
MLESYSKKSNKFNPAMKAGAPLEIRTNIDDNFQIINTNKTTQASEEVINRFFH